ncbi:MFS transporter [Actinomadura sp. NBRC 104412]|uniref:MFS transporter n=1 Tax=Actinomadura sp. NBRC 104412 TaxID=3032203 RepID=UPI0024A06DC4|nr:MFS transporter [Actinomadura sp. NBRC 104412]GLZ07318.1 MFS transporter [Actinomadura sp. NBRC 104412]
MSERAGTARRRPPHVAWTLVLAPIGVFLTALDVVVVSTALPAIQRELGAGLADLEWTLNAYNLAFACLMLTGAALGDRFGRRRMFVSGVLVFSLASAAAALSGSAAELIVARVVQGAGAAVIMPLTLTLIVDAFPASRRGTALGIWGGVTGLGVAAGPVVGGAITEGVSWQWIFWVNVPVGLALAALSAVRLRESHGPRSRLDPLGLVLIAAGLFALTWAPVRAPAIGWGTFEVIGAALSGALLVGAFVAWERRARYPMMPLALFRLRGFVTANAIGFLQQMSIIGSLFMLSQMFQVGLGYSPWEAGLRILVWNGTVMVVAPIAGALADRFGDRPVLIAGMALQGTGLGWVATVAQVDVGYGALVVPLLVAGVGIAMCLPPVANLVTISVPFEEAGVAAGVNSAMRELGSVFGVAVVALIFASYGGYTTSSTFMTGFQPAMWTAAAIALAATIPAFLAPRKANVQPPMTPAPEAVKSAS